MHSTTRQEIHPTIMHRGGTASPPDPELLKHYSEIVGQRRLNWTSYHHLGRLLGSGGQGKVYLTNRRGADGFTLPVALKVFSPEKYEGAKQYEEAMGRMAEIAARVAMIQHDNVLDVQNFVDRHRIRIMVMEWVDGYDLRQLSSTDYLVRLRQQVSSRRWRYINEVIVTAGPQQSRFKAGVAVAIVRQCLAALAALHREGIVHGDVKPANIMLKRTGHLKLIDIGSAFDFRVPPRTRSCTPNYASPEVLENGEATPRSDLASLGYVLLELLSGRPLFTEEQTLRSLLVAKRELPQRLHEFLPEEVTCNALLMNFCRGLIAPDPNRRFPSAEAAEHVEQGAAAFHRQLIMGNMATEYDNDIRVWLEELKMFDTDYEVEVDSDSRDLSS